VPIRELGNITFDTFTSCATTNKMVSENDVVIGGDSFDSLFDNACNNYDKVHSHSLTHNAHSPRTQFMFLSKCEESYAEKMERQNDRMNKDKLVILTNSAIVLEHVIPGSQKG